MALSFDLEHIHATVVATVGAYMMRQTHLVARGAFDKLDWMKGIMGATAMGAPMGMLAFR